MPLIFFTDAIFNRIKERGIEDRIAKRLRLNGVSEDIIKRFCLPL